jgi:hypothetical protein
VVNLFGRLSLFLGISLQGDYLVSKVSRVTHIYKLKNKVENLTLELFDKISVADLSHLSSDEFASHLYSRLCIYIQNNAIDVVQLLIE